MAQRPWDVIPANPEDPNPTVNINTAAALMDVGTVVVMNGRRYIYVLVDAGATVPANTGLVYYKVAPTPTTWTVTNGANGLTEATNRSLIVAGLVYYQITAGRFGFLQIGGPSNGAVALDTGVTLIGQNVVSNLSNAATPAQGLLLSSTNIVFATYVGRCLTTPSGNAATLLLGISPWSGG